VAIVPGGWRRGMTDSWRHRTVKLAGYMCPAGRTTADLA
jgi:hypothetical protein